MADYTLPGRAFARKENIEIRYNPYHDPSNGRFCSGGGGGGGAVLVVNKGQKGKGVYVVDMQKQKSNVKYNGISVTSSDTGKTRNYIEMNGGYFELENGNAIRLDSKMQKQLSSMGGLSGFAKKVVANGNKATDISDDEVEKSIANYHEKQKNKTDYELGNVFKTHGWAAEKRKAIYRPRRSR